MIGFQAKRSFKICTEDPVKLSICESGDRSISVDARRSNVHIVPALDSHRRACNYPLPVLVVATPTSTSIQLYFHRFLY